MITATQKDTAIVAMTVIITEMDTTLTIVTILDMTNKDILMIDNILVRDVMRQNYMQGINTFISAMKMTFTTV